MSKATVAAAALSLAVLSSPVQAQDEPPPAQVEETVDVLFTRGIQRRAEQGEAEAQTNLGALHLVGSGVPQDYVEAAAWFRKAAEQGHAGAANLLGERYDLGEGVPQDDVEAHMWLNLAASGSTVSSLRAMFVTARDRVAERMTPADLSEAQRRAREWHAAHLIP